MKRKRLHQAPEEQLQLPEPVAIDLSTLLDWSHFEQRTDGGTLLVNLTLEAAQMDLDGWAFQERTGVIMPKGQRLNTVAWKSVLEKVGMSVGSIDRKKLWSALETDLSNYETQQASKRSASIGISLDPKVLKEVSAALHKVFSTVKTDVLDIGGLAGIYTAQEGGDYEENKATIRSVLNHPASSNTFSMGLGGSPKVSRLQTATGKKTGEEPQSRVRKPKGSA